MSRGEIKHVSREIVITRWIIETGQGIFMLAGASLSLRLDLELFAQCSPHFWLLFSAGESVDHVRERTSIFP